MAIRLIGTHSAPAAHSGLVLSTPAMRAAAFFGAPTRQVVEFGTEIEI